MVLDCAEFNNTDISHVSFIELSLSIYHTWLVLAFVFLFAGFAACRKKEVF